MSARIEIKPGHTYRTHGGRFLRVTHVAGWKVTYREVYPDRMPVSEPMFSSVPSFDAAIAEDVTS